MSDPRCESVPESPRVSVVVPNYNHRPFLPERLETILAQTFTDYELLLLDDASDDGSVEILQEYADRPNVRLLVNRSNSGSPFAQWNRGVEQARGKYVWIAESDDTAEPQLLETLVGILEDHPNVGMAECDAPRIDSNGNPLEPFEWDARPEYAHRWSESFLADGRKEIRQFLYLQNTIPSASAIVFRRSVYLQAGRADATLKICGDWLQWARMLVFSDLYFLAEPLARSRIHCATQRETTWKNGHSMLEALFVQQQIQRFIKIDHQTIRRGTQRYATSWLQNVRAGRYRGSIYSHFVCVLRVLRNDRAVGVRFLIRLPYALLVWFAKNTIFRQE